jgi:hypothetical protein
MLRVATVRAFAAACLFPVVFAAALPAQCANVWLRANGELGVDDTVRASTMWDPDGAGPAPSRLVLAGHFTVAGNIAANRIAAWDPVTREWSAFGTGINSIVYALAVLPSGDLIAGGVFTQAGGVNTNGVARWDGTAWQPLGSGMGPVPNAMTGVMDLAVLPNGDLIAGGTFTTAGGVAAANIARWDGAAWSPLGSGTSGSVYALLAGPNGDLVAGGAFQLAGGIQVGCIARWNGATWSGFGTGVAHPSTPGVGSLARLLNGDLVIAGQFSSVSGVAAQYTARWDGTAWSPLGGGPGEYVELLGTLSNGDLVTTGPVNSLRRWDGTTWSPFAAGVFAAGSTMTILPNGDLVVACVNLVGAPLGNALPLYVARWDGTTWHPLSAALNGAVEVLATMHDGTVVAAGVFTMGPSAANARNVARWNGSAWSVLGSGFFHSAFLTLPQIGAIADLQNGDVVAGGSFTTAGGVAAANIARWNGVAWSPLGGGVDGVVYAMVRLPNGDLVAGGMFTTAGGVAAANIARWNGLAWSPLGAGVGGGVFALAVLPNGDLVAGGGFPTAGGVAANRIARWDGTAWSPLGAGFFHPIGASVRAMVTLTDGSLIATGEFTTAGGVAANQIARWNGAAWSALQPGFHPLIFAFAALPDGDFIAAGAFNTLGQSSVAKLARWNGTTWVDSGLGYNPFDVAPAALTTLPDGDLLVGGPFHTAGGLQSRFVARISTTCPATADPFGTGCAGAGGTNVLTATALPWVGSTYRARATGMPPIGFVAFVTGFTPLALPLQPLFPQAGAGCLGYATADWIEVALPAGGAADSDLVLPNNSWLVGATFHQYALTFEGDAFGTLVAITSSNALTATLGAF